MNFAPNYLAVRLFYRLLDFFHHWYVDGSRNFTHYFINFLEGLDRWIAFRITLKHFFQPLYKDYTLIGRILGVIFRSGRLTIGLVIYTFVSVLFLAIYLIWLAIPPSIIFYAISNF